MDLITSQDGDIPLFVRVGDGNESDKAVFGKVLVEFKKQIKFDSIMVCDSALYGQENLQLIQHLKVLPNLLCKNHKNFRTELCAIAR